MWGSVSVYPCVISNGPVRRIVPEREKDEREEEAEYEMSEEYVTDEYEYVR